MLNVSARISKLKALKSSILRHEKEIHAALKHDLGKSFFESYIAEVGFILEDIQHALKHIDSWTKIKKVSTPLTLLPAQSFIVPEPVGKVLIIAPWNYPFQLSLSPLIGAISAGNLVVLKPSEFAPEVARVLKVVLDEAFTHEEVEVALGGVEVTTELLKKKFNHIFFTGSTQVGRIVMRAAAEHLTPVTLELGGKSPFLIEESANLDSAAKRCAWGKFMNAGQTCVAPDYVLVPEHLKDEFITKIKNHLSNFYTQNPEASEDYGRIINERHWERLNALIPREKVVIGGQSTKPNYLAPTVLKDVQWNDKVMEDEIFGPILPVLTYKSLDEAIAKINQRPKPLAFYVFSEDQTIAQEIIQRVSFGGGCINDCVIHLANPNLPFGGVGDSGMGSYHGQKSFEIFTHFKSLIKNTTKVDIPLRYPPFAGKLNWIKRFLG